VAPILGEGENSLYSNVAQSAKAISRNAPFAGRAGVGRLETRFLASHDEALYRQRNSGGLKELAL